MSRIGNLIKKAQAYKGQEFLQPKMFVPSGMIVPETAKTTMARQLYQAGIITKDDYENMLGVVYDDDIKDKLQEDFSDESFSTYDDEFKLSELAEYYDEDTERDVSYSQKLEASSAGVDASAATSVSEVESDNRDSRDSSSSETSEGS